MIAAGAVGGCASWPQADAADLAPSSTGAQLARSPDAAGPFPVLAVVDGDTLWVQQPQQRVKVRLLGIDTPETRAPGGAPVECFRPEASAAAEAALAGVDVWLESDPSQDTFDQYGRLLAYVWLDQDLVNLDLVADGFAAEYTFRGRPYRYQEAFLGAQARAQQAGVGQWSACAGG